MKKLVLFLTIVTSWIITACTADVPPELEAQNDNAINTSCIVSNDAINLAKRIPSFFESENSRAIEKAIDLSLIYPITNKALSRNSDVDTALFVINYKNEQGFSIITASKENPDLIAYIPEGSYKPEIGTDNVGFNLYLNTIMRVLEKDSTQNKDVYAIDPDGKQRKTETDTIQYGPCTRMERTRWGQDRIFGQYCPNGLAGCAPLAITAIIGRANTYLGKKSRFYYNYPGVDLSYEDIDWTEFMRHQQSYAVEFNNITGDIEVHEHICWQANPEESHKTIGRVIRQIGKELNANYYEFETTTLRQNYYPVLKKYLPEAEIVDLKAYTPETIMREIDKGLVLMRADPKNSEVGHTWIADGYHYIQIRVTYYEKYPSETRWTAVKQESSHTAYSHFLWGYNGVYDGWYSGVAFDPQRNGLSYIDPQYISIRVY